MTDDEIKERIEQLDANVSKDGAKVYIEFGGGQGCEVTANRAGYLRLAAEMFKAAITPLDPSQMFAPVTIDYLTLDRSMKVRRFSRCEDIESALPAVRTRTQSWKNKAAGVGCIAAALFAAACALIGFVEVLGWISH